MVGKKYIRSGGGRGENVLRVKTSPQHNRICSQTGGRCSRNAASGARLRRAAHAVSGLVRDCVNPLTSCAALLRHSRSRPTRVPPRGYSTSRAVLREANSWIEQKEIP